MAGTGLIAIKRRIKSITNTKKITKAMGLVATSKLRKSREQMKVNDKYYNEFHNIMEEILTNSEEENIYTTGNKNKNKLYIVLTSDTGLCGGYNWAVANKAMEEFKNSKEKTSVITVGQKGRSIFNKFKIETLAEYVEIQDIPSIKEANDIMKHALTLYNKGEVGEIHLVYTHFISPVNQDVKSEQLLPFEIKFKKSSEKYIEFDPNIDTLIENVTETYLSGKLLNSMLHSKASEQSSRMEAMDGATRNAIDLLESLQLKYNRIRQSAITQEISEIVGGAEAQK